MMHRNSQAIRRPALYYAVLEAVRTPAIRGILPTTTLLPNRFVYRSIPRHHYRSPLSGLYIPLDSATADGNRWNGMRPTQDEGRGNAALYTGMWDAVRAERHHYGVFRDASIELLRAVENGSVSFNSVDLAAFASQGAQTIVGMAVTKPVEMVDVSRLVSSVTSNREVVLALQGQSAESALMSDDYSFARAISHGISDANAGYAGLMAPTARAVITVSASNLVFFGDPANTIATVPLQPMLIYNVEGLTSKGKLRINVRNAEAHTPSSETSSGTQSS